MVEYLSSPSAQVHRELVVFDTRQVYAEYVIYYRLDTPEEEEERRVRLEMAQQQRQLVDFMRVITEMNRQSHQSALGLARTQRGSSYGRLIADYNSDDADDLLGVAVGLAEAAAHRAGDGGLTSYREASCLLKMALCMQCCALAF